MASKAQTPPPIDKPLARAYLRKFTGWSTAYPPGTSDPTSLRVMLAPLAAVEPVPGSTRLPI